jgi:hypothetical protein
MARPRLLKNQNKMRKLTNTGHRTAVQLAAEPRF